MTSVSFFLRQILPIFLTLLLASFDTSLANSVFASSYAQHCSSIAPEFSQTKLLVGASNTFLISEGLFSSGHRINNLLFPPSKETTSIHDAHSSSIFHFQPGQVHRTYDDNTLRLEGTLTLLGSRVPIRNRTIWSRQHGNRREIIFKLSGFWSEAKGQLCMIGTGEIHASQDDHVAFRLNVVLKLEFPKVSTIKTSIIEGSIESSDIDSSPAYFEPISLFAYAQRRYVYTMTEQACESCSHLPLQESIEWDSTSICFNLENTIRYERFTSSGLVDFLGFRFLSISKFVCSDDGKVHLSMMLSNKTTSIRYNNKPFYKTKLLVAEGAWDHHKSRLCLLACELIDKENNMFSSVRDCSLRLTFWFPTIFSLKQRNTVVGRMWNTSDTSKYKKNTVVSLYNIYGYFRTDEVPNLKYEYTELEKARKNCRIKNIKPKKTGRYPDSQLNMDMRFQLSQHGTNGKSTLGDGKQIAIGETYHGNQYGAIMHENNITMEGTPNSPSSSLSNQNATVWNVGYAISYTIRDKNTFDSVDIDAEGIYNSTTGTLCLIGCRRPSFSHTIKDEILNSSAIIDDRNLDCTFFIQLQLPSLDSTNKEGKGTIESIRAKSDPLYFEPLKVKLYLIDIGYSMQEYNWMDAEMIMVIISLTFLCICLYLQLRHVRKNNILQPLMSITMIVELILDCIISLISNTEAGFVPTRNRQVFLQNGKWVDATIAIARFISLVALLIYYRLLQLAWGSRWKGETTQVIYCSAEKKSLIICTPLYIVGALVAWLSHSHINKYRQTIMDDLEQYVCFVVDNFLLPQIIFNVYSQSREKVLTPFFYVGATMVRVVPHIYNLYMAWWHPVNFYNPSYIYPNHGENYSTLFDIIVPFEGLSFVLLVYLQQRFGGRCFLPKRLRHNSGNYEHVYISDI